MAGFKVLWASEFIDSARDTYKANCAPYTIVDGRDIREVQAKDILEASGIEVGELDLFDGSPPCSSFSTAGKREKGWGQIKKYSDKEQRTDDLFFEYSRLIRGLQPKVFVAENVAGLIKGTAKGYFLEILRELKACGYRVSCKVLDAQWLGVPQARQRTIFVGVRDDLGLDPVHPRPLPYRYSMSDALPWITRTPEDKGAGLIIGDPAHKQKPGNSFPRGIMIPFTEPAPTVQASKEVMGGSGHSLSNAEHQTDISKHAIGAEWDKLKPGEQSEKYFSLVKVDPEHPCPTVCASHGAHSRAGITHPTEKRKFTIAELRRICGFPDDFILNGTYAQQWERLGRAVPPVMMSHIAAAIRDGILSKL